MMASCPAGGPSFRRRRGINLLTVPSKKAASRKFGGELTGYDPVNDDRGMTTKSVGVLSVIGANSDASQRMQWYRR